MLVIYLHSHILKGFGGIPEPCNPLQYQATKGDASTGPATTGIGTGDTQPRATGHSTWAPQQYPDTVVGPMAYVTTYIKTCLSYIVYIIKSSGMNDTQPGRSERSAQAGPHPPSGGYVEGNVAVTPQKIVTKNLSLPKNPYDSVHIDTIAPGGTRRGDNLLHRIEGSGKLSPRLFITKPELMN